ncbi:pyridoxamine 5'-phosphate oxidase family protein [Streptomyces sp. NPDC005012]|uniref:pyridoxamine 5'-phosphate oxidase family protein n=1 Tax=unclassified Streptomyces TaxID=2593676 RepID=UPI0033B9CD54
MSRYHSGERAVQERAGLAEQAAFSLGGIGDGVPPVARDFLAEQPMIVVGAADAKGRLWATLLTGPPGFLRVPGPRTLLVNAAPAPGDPLDDVLRGAGRGGHGLQVGMIAVETATRRRMRINGRARWTGDGLQVGVDQVVANCPKYLQKREYRWAEGGTGGGRTGGGGRAAGAAVSVGRALDPAQRAAVTAADTFFVATAGGDGDADASHRGGNPGFVRVLSPTLLRWPDYTGNAMFLTLGNLQLNDAAGLLFPDWRTGTLLHLTGTARVLWDPAEAARVPGAQRLVEFAVAGVRELAGASPLRWSDPAYSRFNPPTV